MLQRLYYRAMALLAQGFQSGINTANWLYEYSLNMDASPLRDWLQRQAKSAATIFTFLKLLPRQPAFLVQGEKGSIIYVGEGEKISLFQALFREGYQVTELGRIPIWTLPTVTKRWLETHDLVLCRVSQFFPWEVPATYELDVPTEVEQALILDRPFDALLSAHVSREMRRKARRALEGDFDFRISRDHDDLMEFIEKLYLPTGVTRFGERATMMSVEAIEEIFADGFLVFVSREGKIVGGSLCRLQHGTYTFHLAGIADGNAELYADGVSRALYAYMIRHAIELGAYEINLGFSSAMTSDGVFTYKSRWGATARPSHYICYKLLVRANKLTDAWRETLNRTGFLQSNPEGLLRNYVDGHAQDYSELLAMSIEKGVPGIRIVGNGYSSTLCTITDQALTGIGTVRDANLA